MPATPADVVRVLSYIRSNWHKSVRRDSEPVMGVVLPHPYTTPCVTGSFTFFFYWDTYFTNLGLIPHGELEAARGNGENMMFLIRRHGFMPNHVGIDHRSQPPYFGLMVADLYGATQDVDWLRDAAEHVRQEYHFWVNARATPTGLCRHAHTATFEYVRPVLRADRRSVGLARRPAAGREASHVEPPHRGGRDRLGLQPALRRTLPRLLPGRAELRPLPLRVPAGGVERSAGLGEAELWKERTAARADRMRRYLWSEERGLFLDYDFVNARHSSVASLGSFHPLWAGLATKEEARRAAEALPLFERQYGIAVGEPVEGDTYYQWGYPNAWPPLTCTTVRGLARYGLDEAARRLAQKYVDVSVALFDRTGQLWEKTDVETGDVAGGQDKAQPMLGWSAGVFVALADYLGID